MFVASIWPRFVSRGRSGVGRRLGRQSLASMCPRLVSRGRNVVRPRVARAVKAPMWPRLVGSVVSRLAAEGAAGDRRSRKNVASSMWPRLIAAEWRAMLDWDGRLPQASMWPRLVSRGRDYHREPIGPVVLLLQCGRSRLAAEGSPRAFKTLAFFVASMWPRLVSRGRSARSLRTPGKGACFNVAAAGEPRKATRRC